MKEKQHFVHGLETYNRLILDKEEMKLDALHDEDEEADGLSDLETTIRVLERQTARERVQSRETQEEIFALQEAKASIMQKLHEDLEALDHPEVHPIQEKGSYFVKYDKGKLYSKSIEITKGMLMTDGEWDIRYHLDPSVPLELREEYLIEEAKRRIRALYDRQIIEDQIGSKRTDEGKKSAYTAFKEEAATREQVGGWVAERLVKTFLKRIAIDYDLDLDLIETDVYEDVEHKIDFAIRFKSRARGVDTEAREKDQEKGIQFTLSKNPEALRHKQQQIDKVLARNKTKKDLAVEDIVLVSLPLNAVQALLDSWHKAKSPPGGPAEYFTPQEKQFIFNGVLRGIVERPTIQAQWARVTKKAA